jgi:hypothetical protein
MVIFYDLKEVFRDSKSPPLSRRADKLFKYLMEIDLSHVANCNIDNFHFKILSACLWLLAKWLFYDLKKSSEILKVHRSEELTKLFKYLMEIDLSHEWQTVTSTIFHFKILSACL